MGYYIEVPKNVDKAAQLVELYDAQASVPNLDAVPEGHALICVVSNGAFEAAGIIYDQEELDAASTPSDCRPKWWLTLPRETVVKLCPHVAREFA